MRYLRSPIRASTSRRPSHSGLSLEGIFVFFSRQIIFQHIFFLLTTSAFITTVDTKYPFAQKLLFPYLYFKFACLSNIINDDFPFKYPMKFDIAIFGGILTNIWIWSLIACTSMISTPLYSHSCLMILPISLLIFP